MRQTNRHTSAVASSDRYGMHNQVDLVEGVDALSLRWPCPKQTKTTAVLAGVRVREGCETGSKQVWRW